MITLRALAGAKYLDMIWYCVDVDHVSDLIIDTCNAINCKVNNTKIPTDETDWKAESDLFQDYMIRKHGGVGVGLFEGVVGAGDGFIAKITEPKTFELDGRPAKIYYNRKNTFALLVQAFCGALTKFWYFNV